MSNQLLFYSYLDPEEANEANPFWISPERSSILGWIDGLLAVRLSRWLLCWDSNAAIFAFFFSPAPGGEPMGSTQFLHPIHLHMAEQAILACASKYHCYDRFLGQYRQLNQWITCWNDLVTFAVVLEASGAFAVTALVVTSRFGTPSGADFRFERVRIAIQTRSDGPQSQLFVVQIVGAAHAVAPVAKFPVSKTITVSKKKKKI